MSDKKQRVQFYFDPSVVEALDKIREATGISSRADVVRYACRTFQWVLNELGQGNDIFIRQSGTHTLNQVLFPFYVRPGSIPEGAATRHETIS